MAEQDAPKEKVDVKELVRDVKGEESLTRDNGIRVSRGKPKRKQKQRRGFKGR